MNLCLFLFFISSSQIKMKWLLINVLNILQLLSALISHMYVEFLSFKANG